MRYLGQIKEYGLTAETEPQSIPPVKIPQGTLAQHTFEPNYDSNKVSSVPAFHGRHLSTQQEDALNFQLGEYL